ncbi:hypothetical protein GF412_04585 [Candidatus Micrarchaeota archaeon]|nr:hypothetical protein [Candidatus Micrarchaeota archaeon]MBD3418229.1 hypothetical protein [Candidatus Micrarchaeota archaeon]
MMNRIKEEQDARPARGRQTRDLPRIGGFSGKGQRRGPFRRAGSLDLHLGMEGVKEELRQDLRRALNANGNNPSRRKYVQRLCKLGTRFLEIAGRGGEGGNTEDKILLAAVYEASKTQLGRLARERGDGQKRKTLVDVNVLKFVSKYEEHLGKTDDPDQQIDLFGGTTAERIKKRLAEGVTAERIKKRLSGPDQKGGRRVRFYSIPPGAPAVFALSEEGVFRRIGPGEAGERFGDSVLNDRFNDIMRAVEGPDGSYVPLVNVENRLSTPIIGEKGDKRRNACFYLLSKSARNGMDRKTWPAYLDEALEAEKWWFGLLVSSRKEKDGTFLECGGGDGRCLVQEHERRGLGSRFTVYDYFGHLVSVDYSWQMNYEASKVIASKIGVEGVKRTRIILGELGAMDYLGSDSVDLAACMFNTFGNMNIRDQMHMSEHLNRVLRKYDPASPNPALAFFTVYRDRPETERVQEEFYHNMGMEIAEKRDRVVVTNTHENGGSNQKFTFKSQRFTEEELKIPIESGGSGLIVLDVFPISTIMMGAIAVSCDCCKGEERQEEIRRAVLEETEIGRRIQEAKTRDSMEKPDWNWNDPVR